MPKTTRTVWRTAADNRDLLEYDNAKGDIVIPILSPDVRELRELADAIHELLEILATHPLPLTRKGGAQ